jgi:hypothetical protein
VRVSNNQIEIGLAVVLIILLLVPFCPISKAQTTTSFSPNDRFNLPDRNGSIHFALNGTYSKATYENSTWNFKDLALNGTQLVGDLKISAENSNITIYFFRATNNSLLSAQIRFYAEGSGKQTVNFGNIFRKTDVSEWSVLNYGNSSASTVFHAPGKAWQLLPDNTVSVTGLTGNVSVVHYRFNASVDSNLPFIEQHSLLIIVATILASVVLAGLVVKFKAGAKKDGL